MFKYINIINLIKNIRLLKLCLKFTILIYNLFVKLKSIFYNENLKGKRKKIEV